MHIRKRGHDKSVNPDELVMTTGPVEPLSSVEQIGPSNKDQILQAIPSSDFQPSPEEILRFCSSLSARTVLALHNHRLTYYYMPLSADISSRLPSGVSLKPNPLPDVSRETSVFGQLRLRRKNGFLRDVGLEPDPLTPFASLAASLSAEELILVFLSWEPVRPREAIRWVQDQVSWNGMASAVWNELWFKRSPQMTPSRSVEKVPALVYLHISYAVYSSSQARSGELSREVVSCFSQYKSRAWFEHRSTHALKLGTPWRHGQIAAVAEIGGLLLPPKSSCLATNTPRTGGYVPDAPPLFVRYRNDNPDVLPWGKIGDEYSGIPRNLTYFVFEGGHSGAGKSIRAKSVFLHLARNGIGAAYIDPDRDGIESVKRWLGPVSDRVLEVNLRPQNSELLVPGWNPVSVSDASQIEGATADVVDAFSAALKWGQSSTRAKSILMMSTQALCELALKLPPQDHPTIFQIPLLLHNDAWRMAITAHLSPLAQHYFENQFPDEPKEAKAIVARAIYVLASSPAVSAFLGASESSYSARRAMDTGQILLVCPKADADETTRILTNLIVSDLVRSALSRDSVLEDQRREFWAILDELEELPASMVVRALNHARKYKLRLWALSQGPGQLDREIWDGLGRNASALVTSGTGDTDAKLYSSRWGGKVKPDTIMDLPSHEFIGAVRIGKEWTNPHRFASVPVEELWGSGEDNVDFPSAALYTPEQIRESQATLATRIVQGLGVAQRPRARTRSTVAREALPEGEG